MPYKDNFFNNAISIATLHCLETKKAREKSLQELYRVLKLRARVFLKVWNKEHKRFLNKGKEKYIRWLDKGARYYYLYTEDELKKELENIGFKIIFSESKKGLKVLDEIVMIAQKP